MSLIKSAATLCVRSRPKIVDLLSICGRKIRQQAGFSRNAQKILLRQGLSILTDIPHASKLEIAENRKSDPLSSEVDIVVYGEFRDAAALAAYKAHELCAEAIRRVRPLRELRIAADYDSSTAITELETSGKPTAGDLPVGQ